MSDKVFSATKFFDFIYRTRTALNFGALFSDGTADYVSPYEPKTGDDVTIKFRTASDNVDEVFLIAGGERYRKCIF